MIDNLARAPFSPAWSSLAHPSVPAGPPDVPVSVGKPRVRLAAVRSSGAAKRSRPRMFYAVTACAGVAAIFIVKLLLSVAISQGAYQFSSLESTATQLTRAEQTATENLDRVRSPQYLAANAAALGMVSNTHPVYLRLSDGAVLGQPQRADGTGASSGALALVPNSLVVGAPLVTQQPAAGAAPTAATGAGPAAGAGAGLTAAAAPDAAATPPEPTAIPVPVTH